MLKRYHAFICIGLLLFVLLGMLYLSGNQADYDNRTLLPQQFQNMTTGNMFMEKGSYTFTFNYTYAPDVQVQVVRVLTANANNILPAVLASEPLHESGQTVITLTLPEAMHDIQLRFTGEVPLSFTYVNSVGQVWNDMRLLLLMVALAALIMGWMFLKEQRGRDTLQLNDTGYSEATIHLLLLAVAVYATLPVIRDFLINGHDMPFHLMRIESIKDGLLDGQFPVRIGPTFWGGLGNASSMVYPELFLYIPAVLRLCGVSLMVAYEAFVFLMNLATFLVAYHAIKKLTGKATIGLIVSLVYGLGVSRMITLYTRAAVGETLAMIFFPCVLLGMVEVLHRGKFSKWLIVGMTGLIQTHVVSVEIALLFCALYTVIVLILRKTAWRNILRLLLVAGVTLLINLWFLVPFFRFLQEDLNMFSYTKRTTLHMLYPAQWFSSFLNPFGTAEYLGTTVEMPLSVGVLPGIGILLYILTGHKDDRDLRAVGHVSLGFGLLALAVTSTIFPWTYVATMPVLSDILLSVQFPWRYLGVAGFFLAIVFGISAYGIGRGHRKLLVAACLVLAVFNIAPFFNEFVQSDEQKYVMKDKLDMATALDCYIPIDYAYSDTDSTTLLNDPMVITTSGDIQINNFTKRGTQITFDYAADTPQTVSLPLYLYPGYTVTLNGTQISDITETGHLLTLSLPAGSGSLFVRYEGFWYFTLSNYISLCTLLILLAFGVRRLPHAGLLPKRAKDADKQ